MEIQVGFRFSPTDEEIVDHYLRLKNVGGSTTSNVDEVIRTVDIYSFDPWELPSLSRRESRDHVWYFFGCKKNQQNRGERQSRKTKSGFWKKTGVTTDVIRKRGDREKLGEKRVLVFQSKPDWVMHEYVATTFLSPNQMTTYTVCKVIFKGDARDLSFSSSAAAAEIEHVHSQFPHMNNFGGSEGLQNPRQFSDFLDAEEEAQIDDAITRAIDNLSTGDLNSLLNNDEEQRNIMFMQEDRSDYRPKMSLTGVFIGYSDDDSDSDLISATTCSIQTSSTCDSFCSSNRRIYQVKDLQESPNSTVELRSVTQQVNIPLGTNINTSEKKMNPYDHTQGSEVGGDKMGQEVVIKNKRAGFLYRMMQKYTKKIKLCSSISRT